MAGTKQTESVTLTEAQFAWLDEMARKHSLPGRDKALRCVLDCAMAEVDEVALFQTIRCPECGSDGRCRHGD